MKKGEEREEIKQMKGTNEITLNMLSKLLILASPKLLALDSYTSSSSSSSSFSLPSSAPLSSFPRQT
jgi:hypothetical protein